MRDGKCGRGIALCLALLFGGASAVAQPDPGEKPVVVPSTGSEIFRHWVHVAGYRPLNSWRQAYDDPRHSLVIIFGDIGDVPGLEQFLREGGAVLVATDRACTAKFLGLSISGSMVEVTNKSDAYRGSRAFPKVVPIVGKDAVKESSPRHIFLHKLLQPVVTNAPSSLREEAPLAEAKLERVELASYPDSAHFTDRRDFDPKRDLFAVGGHYGDGRFLFLADHSLFINAMMTQVNEDNANEEFARRCLEWLRDGPDGPRWRCCFLENGEPKTRFALPTPPRPEPPLDELADAIMSHGDQLVRELEDKNFVDQLLVDQFGERPIIRFILVTLSVLLILYGLFKLWGARTGAEPAALLGAGPMAPRGSAVRQRAAAQIDSGNLYELARDRVREKLGPFVPADAGAGAQPPRVVVAEDVSAARRLRQSVEHLWRIGYGEIPLPLPRRDWAWFNAELERAVRGARDGRWRFEPASDRT